MKSMGEHMEDEAGQSRKAESNPELEAFRASGKLWADLITYEEKADFIECGRAWETGIIAKSMETELAQVYRWLSGV